MTRRAQGFAVAVRIQHAAAGNSLRLITLQPGQVAPGMAATVEVELQARTIGSLNTAVDIATEAGVISIPVTARVARSTSTPLARGVRQVSGKDAQVCRGCLVCGQRPVHAPVQRRWHRLTHALDDATPPTRSTRRCSHQHTQRTGARKSP